MSIEEAHAFFIHQIRYMPFDSILALRRAAIVGEFDGRCYDSCVYGNMAKGSGYDFHGKSNEEVQVSLRHFGKSIGIRIRANGQMDLLEQFCAHVSRGDTAKTSPPLSCIVEWCDEEIARRNTLTAREMSLHCIDESMAIADC
ncbi:MAG: hypothetical protein AAB660_02285 [Patescibacteria group bacterium]